MNTRIREIAKWSVFGGVALISYSHTFTDAYTHGNGVIQALAYPLIIDGLILYCVLTVSATTGVNRPTKFWCGIGRILGFALTIGFNFMAANLHDPMSVAINTAPGAVMIVVAEAVVHSARGVYAGRKPAKKTTK